MKLHLLDRSSLENYSLNLVHNRYPHFLKIWHYHPELELVYILQGTGTRFIGDSIEKFEPGNLVLTGKNVPHMWLSDEEYFNDSSDLMAEALGVHFRADFLGDAFLQVPEMQAIQQLFRRAQQGIHFRDPAPSVLESVRELFQLDPFERVMQLIRLLYKLAGHRDFTLLSTPGFMQSFHQTDHRVLDEVYAFVFKNFKKPIGSRDVAEVACMHPSAFSRFFKRVHRKPFTRYLNEVRIGYACKLLMENKLTISQICYESGFSNISNFNRQFRKIMDRSPSEYINYHQLN